MAWSYKKSTVIMTKGFASSPWKRGFCLKEVIAKMKRPGSVMVPIAENENHFFEASGVESCVLF